jgi:hypothetical protein
MRRQPTEGAAVTVVYLAAREAGVIELVEDEGRAVTVVTSDGEVLRFGLAASGHFVTADGSARLLL